MKRLLPNIVIPLIIGMFVLNGFGLIAPHQAFAEVIQNSSGIIQNASSSAGSASSSVCSIGNLPTCLADIVLVIPGYMAAYLIMPIMSLLVYLSGMILNISMEYSVVHMSLHYQQTGVDYVWTVVRDLANMGFIFILLYTAIMTMVGKAKWQEAIKNIVLAALLINFSLLITKAIVDMSNVLAMLFYNAITPGGTTTTTGLASGFMNVLNLQSLHNLASGIKGTQMAIVGIAGSVIYLIASSTFLAVAIMFLIRFVALVFVIALSPIYALAMILPQLRSQADMWLKTLINQSFFAPLYFALTWIALKVSEGLLAGFSQSDGTTAIHTLNYSAAILGQSTGNAVKANPDAVGVFVMFAIIISLLIGALTISKSMANKSHPMLKSITGKALGFAGGATLGIAGRAGRGTFGRLGVNIAENDMLKDRVAKGGMLGRAARLTMAAGDKTAKSSFDLRATGIGGQLGAGKAQKGGFAADTKQKAKDAKTLADSLKPSDLRVKAAEDALKEAQKGTNQKAIAAAQFEVDRLKGADENEMRKRRVRQIREASGWTVSEKDAKKQIGAQENRYQQQIYSLKQTGLTQKQAEDKLKEDRQKEVDRLVSTGISKEKAEQKVIETHGWKPEEIKSLGNQRKETFAKRLETTDTWLGKAAVGPLAKYKAKLERATPDTARVLMFGKLKRENIGAASEIRKGMKEKKSADKIADEIAKQAKEAVEEESGETPPASGTGSTPPAPGAPTP